MQRPELEQQRRRHVLEVYELDVALAIVGMDIALPTDRRTQAVIDGRRRHIKALVPAQLSSEAEVGVLVHHKEVLIEEPDVIQHFPPIHRSPRGGPEDLPWPIIALRRQHVPDLAGPTLLS